MVFIISKSKLAKKGAGSACFRNIFNKSRIPLLAVTRRRHNLFTTLLLFFPAFNCIAEQDTTLRGMAFPGFTGLINTPNALIAPEGRVDLQYNNQLESIYAGKVIQPRNYLFSLGLLPHIELGGRLAVRNDPRQNRGILLGGIRDLSGNIKVHAPLPARFPDIAVGVQDFAGAAVNYRARYFIVSDTLFNTRFSAGYGFGPDRMNGLFGGIELPLHAQVTVLAENDGAETNLGVRIKTNLFGQAQGEILAKVATDAVNNQKSVGVGFSFDLGKTHRYKGRVLTKADKAPPAAKSNASALAEIANPNADDPPLYLPELIERLHQQGFEHLNIGRKKYNSLVIEAENSLYNQNFTDALGVALGIAVETADSATPNIEIRLKKQGSSLITVKVAKNSFENFLQNPNNEEQLSGNNFQISFATASDDSIEWLYTDSARRKYAEIILYPHIRSFIGTEIGVIDYSLALRSQLQIPLWQGGMISTSIDVPAMTSSNFEGQRPFSTFRHTSGMQDLFLHQLYKPLSNLTNLTSIGQMTVDNEDYRGIFNETYWYWGNQGHRLRLKLSHMESSALTREMWIAGVRYPIPALNVTLDANYGQYWYGDRGLEINASRFYGDTQITLFYKNNIDQAGGLRFSIPLTPQRDLAMGPIVLRGTARWEYGLQTSIQADDTTNPIDTNILVDIKQFYTLEKDIFDSGRLLPVYIENNLQRMRDAYIRYAKEYP